LKQEGGNFLIFQGIILLVLWDGVFGGSKWECFSFFLFFFCDMVIFEDFFLKKIFYKNLYPFLGNKKISTQKVNIKNLTERTKNILFKIEHLINLTKQRKKSFLSFVCLNFLYT
jgi:hypothetical protein